VQVANGSASVAVPPLGGRSFGSTGAPRLSRLIELDGRRGFEMAVTMQLGASITEALFFDFRGGRIVRLGVEGQEFRDAVAYGGSVDDRVAVDCAGPRTLVSSLASLRPLGSARYVVARHTLRLVGLLFVPTGTTRSVLTVHQLSRVPEFHFEPFHSCQHPD